MPVGWTAAGRKTGGKSGLHGETVPVNGRRGRPQGKYHRKQYRLPFRWQVRVKRCGKSAPRGRQRSRQGKPHREQDRIGMTRGRKPSGPLQPRRPGWLLETAGNSRPRGMVVTRGSNSPPYRTRLTDRLAY